MSAWLGDLTHNSQTAIALPVASYTTGTTNATGVDFQKTEGPATLIVQVGAITGSYSTLQITLTESDDNTTFVAMTEAPATIQVLLANTVTPITFWKRAKRYVRANLVATAGSTALIGATFVTRYKLFDPAKDGHQG